MTALFICVMMLPALLFAQTKAEPKKCPWGCPTFRMNSNTLLSSDTKAILDRIASEMVQFPECTFTVFAYPDTSASNKISCEKKLKTVKNYLVEVNGIETERITTIAKVKGGLKNAIDIKSDYDFAANKAVKTNACPCDYASLYFSNDASALSADVKRLLNTSATRLKSAPFCSIIVTSYSEPSKRGQALSDQRLNAIKIYLIEKENISADRIVTNNAIGEGDKNTIDIKCLE